MRKLLFIILLICSSKLFAQDPLLLSNDWYFQYGNQNGEDFFLPYSSFEAKLQFSEFGFEIAHPECEEVLIDEISYLNMDMFDLAGNILILLGFCDPDNFISGKHYRIYYDGGYVPKNTFAYIIEADNDEYQLTIMNNNGDLAVYVNVFLSNPDFKKLKLSIYPNPVIDILFLQTNTVPDSIRIYDMNGKLLIEQLGLSAREFQLDVEFLEAGLYFLEQTNGDLKQIDRFVKK